MFSRQKKKNVIRYKVQNKPVHVLSIQGLFNCATALLSEFKLLIEKFNFFFLLHLNLKSQQRLPSTFSTTEYYYSSTLCIQKLNIIIIFIGTS